MNPVSSIVVQAHINELLADAANERLARSARAARNEPNRFANAVKSVWSTLFGSVDQPGSLPSLANYPYRG